MILRKVQIAGTTPKRHAMAPPAFRVLLRISPRKTNVSGREQKMPKSAVVEQSVEELTEAHPRQQSAPKDWSPKSIQILIHWKTYLWQLGWRLIAHRAKRQHRPLRSLAKLKRHPLQSHRPRLNQLLILPRRAPLRPASPDLRSPRRRGETSTLKRGKHARRHLLCGRNQETCKVGTKVAPRRTIPRPPKVLSLTNRTVVPRADSTARSR